MSSFCGECRLTFQKGDTVVNCGGACRGSFHVGCVESDGVVDRTAFKLWKCLNCMKDFSGDVQSAESTTLTKELLDNSLELFKREVLGELKLNSTQLEEFSISFQLLCDSINISNTLTEDVRKDYVDLRKTNKSLAKEHEKLNRSVKELKNRVQLLEQHSDRTDAEIHVESCEKMVKEMTTIVNQEEKERDDSIADQASIIKKNKSSGVIVQFQSRLTNDARRKNTSSAPEVNSVSFLNKEC